MSNCIVIVMKYYGNRLSVTGLVRLIPIPPT